MTISRYVKFLWVSLLSLLFQIHVSVVVLFGDPFVFSLREIFNVADITIRFSINIKNMIRNIKGGHFNRPVSRSRLFLFGPSSSYSVVPSFHKPSSRFVMYTNSCCSGSYIPNVDLLPSLPAKFFDRDF